MLSLYIINILLHMHHIYCCFGSNVVCIYIFLLLGPVTSSSHRCRLGTHPRISSLRSLILCRLYILLLIRKIHECIYICQRQHLCLSRLNISYMLRGHHIRHSIINHLCMGNILSFDQTISQQQDICIHPNEQQNHLRNLGMKLRINKSYIRVDMLYIQYQVSRIFIYKYSQCRCHQNYLHYCIHICHFDLLCSGRSYYKFYRYQDYRIHCSLVYRLNMLYHLGKYLVYRNICLGLCRIQHCR